MPIVAKPYDLIDQPREVRQVRVSPPIKALQVVPARHPWRWAGSIFAALVLLAIAHSLATNPRWEWGVFGQWFFSPSVLRGLGQTLLLTLLSTVFSVILGHGAGPGATVRLAAWRPWPGLSGSSVRCRPCWC